MSLRPRVSATLARQLRKAEETLKSNRSTESERTYARFVLKMWGK